MLKIRLQRIGKRGQAYFRLVVTEHTTRPKGKYLELLGSYDPHKNSLTTKADRVKHWLSQGAQLSATANNLLVDRKVIEGQKVQAWKAKKNHGNTEKTESSEIKVEEQNKVITTELEDEKPQSISAETETSQSVESGLPTVP